MTVKELISELSKYPENTEILITDGYMCNCYRGDYNVQQFVDLDGAVYVDIGIGGALE